MGGDPNRTKLCPECVNYVDDSASSCSHCGYTFEADAGAVASGPDHVATGDRVEQLDGLNKTGRRIVVAAAAVAIIGGLAVPMFILARGPDSNERFSGVVVPEITVPPIEFTPPSLGTEGTGSFAACRRSAMRWVRELLAEDGAGSRPLSDLFADAADEVGAASDDYWVIVQAFSGSQGVAIQEGTKAGLREARSLVTEGCRDLYP